MPFRNIIALMAASQGIQFVGWASAAGNSANLTIDLTSLAGGLASSPSPNDLVVVANGNARRTDLSMAVVSAGWTDIADLYSNDTRESNLGVAWKKMGGTPDTSVEVPGSGNAGAGSAAVAMVWRGVDRTTPMDATPTTDTGIDTNAADAPSITPVTDGALVVAIGSAAAASAFTFSAPSGYANLQQDDGTGSVDDCATAICTKSWVSGAENPAAFGATGGDAADAWCAVTLALRPA